MRKKDLSYSIQERETNLLDLLWELIYSWRMIFIGGIVFACLLSGMKYGIDSRKYAVDEGDAIENIRLSLTDREILNLERAIVENESIEKQLSSNMEYQRDSILMNLDPYHENQIVLQYYIDSHYALDLNEKIPKDYTKSLSLSYMTYITNSQITQECADKLNMEDDRYLAELIKTDLDSDFDSDSDEKVLNDSTFCISIAGKDMEQAKTIADVVQESFAQYQNELSSKIGAHDLVLIADYEQIIQDNDLAEQQASVETKIYNLKMQQDNLKSKLNAKQLQLLEYEQENAQKVAKGDDANLAAEKVKVGFSKKYMVLGFVFGVFLVCVVIAFRYIFNAHLKNEKELQEIYGLRLFGIIDTLASSKKPFSFVDRWLDRISGKQTGSRPEQIEITIANIIVSCKKFKRDHVFFTSSIHFSEEEKKMIEQMIGRLRKEGIEAIFEENMMKNIKALMQMSETGQVVLVEKADQTKYQALEEELLLCKEQEAEVIGVIAMR